MISILFLLLLNRVWSNELSLTSSRLNVRPEENAYAFGTLTKENVDYFNCTIGDISLYQHDDTINWAWKHKIDYNTDNFTSIINISQNNVLYTGKLNVNILNYTPRITIDKPFLKTEDLIITNKGTFIGNNITTNIGSITTTTNNEWTWVGQKDDLDDYTVVKVSTGSSISNEFFIYKKDLTLAKIYYYLYIPNYITEKEFIDIEIINIATSHTFKIDKSKIVSKMFYEKSNIDGISYFNIFKVTIEFISKDTASYINDNLLNYIEDNSYFYNIINHNTNYGKNIFIYDKPVIQFMTISIENSTRVYVIISIIFFIFAITQFQAIYLYFLIKPFTIKPKLDM